MIERLGGLFGMRIILKDFYDRLFEDTMIGFFFWGRDKDALIERQLEFTARTFGLSVEYHGKTIPDAHAPLPILIGHFNRRHEILRETLEAHHVPDDIRSAWLTMDRAFRRAVVKQK